MALLVNNSYYKIIGIEEDEFSENYVVSLAIYDSIESREKEKVSLPIYETAITLLKTTVDNEYISMVNEVKRLLTLYEGNLDRMEDEEYIRNTYQDCKALMEKYGRLYTEYYYLSTYQKFDYELLYKVISNIEASVIENAIQNKTVCGVSVPISQTDNLLEYCYIKLKELCIPGEPIDV